MKKKVLIILGHPRNDSFCSGLADAYEKGANDAGHEIRKVRVNDLDINLLRDPHAQEDNPEDDVIRVQKDVSWADHMFIVYPTWWAAMPAISKSFFERVFTSGFAFKYKKDSPWWDKLLVGKSARVLATMDAPPFIYKLMFGQPGNKMIKKGILEFCGVKPVKIVNFGPIRSSSDEQRKKWLKEVTLWGEKAN